MIQVNEIPDPLATVLFSTASIWILCSVYFVNKLSKFTGLNEKENKLKVVDFFQREFKNIKCLYYVTGYIYVYISDSKRIGITKIITLIFNNDKVYLNISTLNRRTNSKMFLTGAYDYFKAKKYIENITRV
ncbi:hypothetical protein [Mucilaginibacter sp.]|uniref:hypothetical protein n=1 Tax=Mucilaginibacter sp. TaxID=1882438 RepID=UPI0035BBA7ED